MNTFVCGQTNFWVSGYKHSTKHMNNVRFNFFLYIICNEFNIILTQGRVNIFDPLKSIHCPSKKRNATEKLSRRV